MIRRRRSQAQLTATIVTPREHFTVLRESQRMMIATGDLCNSRSTQSAALHKRRYNSSIRVTDAYEKKRTLR